MDADERHEAREQAVAGARIQEFLNDPIISGALGALEQSYFEQWKRATDVDARERLYAKVSVLEDFRGSLEAIRNDGERAQIELDADRGQPARR